MTALLRIAGLQVPGAQRSDWFAEWSAELWYVRRNSPARALPFCLGAFKDAFWLRRSEPIQLGSPIRCLLLLSIPAALSVLAIWLIPALPAPRDADDVVLISKVPGFAPMAPAMSIADYRSIERGTRDRFTEVTFSRPEHHPNGFVFARLRDRQPGRYTLWSIRVVNENGGVSEYECQSLAGRTRQPFLHFFVAMAYVCIFVPITTPLAIPWSARAWAFLAAKIALLLPVVYCCGALSLQSAYPPLAAMFLLLAFPGSVFAFRWIWIDQRRRCPVCLGLLSDPVGFGQASRTFLGWYGTERTCERGHGVLRVPEIHTSSLGPRRWLCPDDVQSLYNLG